MGTEVELVGDEEPEALAISLSNGQGGWRSRE
jgi:hypothetical protein